MLTTRRLPLLLLVLALPLPALAQDRPAPLMPLYVSFASLQAIDYASTSAALANGHVELNPMMRPIVGQPAAFAAVKVAGTAGVIWLGEKLWKRNRVASVVMMAALNGTMVSVAARNYRNARR